MSASSCGSKWMSEAPSSAAWNRIELTSRTSGSSDRPSSASRSASGRELLIRDPASRTVGARAVAVEARARRPMRSRISSRVGDSELELVRRREPQLVDRVDVARVCDRDRGGRRRRARTGSRRRARARAAERSVAAFSSISRRREVDERQPELRRVMARDRCSSRSPRRRGRARGSPSGARVRRRARAGRRRNELRRADQVDEQVDRLGDAERRRADAVRLDGRRPQAREACLAVSHGRPISRWDPSDEASAFRAARR